MSDGDELPDWDYESIYGREAMRARLLARLEGVERNMARMVQELSRKDLLLPLKDDTQP